MINLEMKEIFKHIDSYPWKPNTDDENVFLEVDKIYDKITDGHSKNGLFYRIAGQSGTGKTTQMLPSIQKVIEKKNINPIFFAVRLFAKSHPDYEKILTEFGQGEVRERTNNFALKCALYAIIRAIDDGFDIVMEITFLTKEFEDLIAKHLTLNNYTSVHLIFAVNKEISDYFVAKRKATSATEKGRVLFKSSSDFFYDVIIQAVGHLSKALPGDRILIWNAYDKSPAFDGKFCDAVVPFVLEQKKTSRNFSDEKELLDAKIDYLTKNI